MDVAAPAPPLNQEKSRGYNELAFALSKTLTRSPRHVISFSPAAVAAAVFAPAAGGEHVGPVDGEGYGDECVHAGEGLEQIV